MAEEEKEFLVEVVKGSKDAENALDGLKNKLKKVQELFKENRKTIEQYNSTISKTKQLMESSKHQNTEEPYQSRKSSITNDSLSTNNLKKLKERLERQKTNFEQAESFKKGINSEPLKQTLGELKEKLSTNAKETGEKVSSSFRRMGEKIASATKRVSTILKQAARRFVVVSLVRAFSSMANSIKSAFKDGNELIRITRTYSAIMGENTEKGNKFVESMSKTFHLAPSSLYDIQSFFYNISTGMGVASKNAYDISENLTRLSYDISSARGVSVEQASDALAGGIEGQESKLRNLGIIVNDNALAQIAMANGIKKNINEMSDAEKVYLRYEAILAQTKNLQGDFAENANKGANASLQLKEATKQLGQALAKIFGPIIEKTAIWMTAIAELTTSVIDKIRKSIGSLVSHITGVKSSFEGMDDKPKSVAQGFKVVDKQVSGTAKKVKELRRELLGFDELNILNENNKSSDILPQYSQNALAPIAENASEQYKNQFELKTSDSEVQKAKDKVEEKKKEIQKTLEITGKNLDPMNDVDLDEVEFNKKIGLGIRNFFLNPTEGLSNWLYENWYKENNLNNPTPTITKDSFKTKIKKEWEKMLEDMKTDAVNFINSVTKIFTGAWIIDVGKWLYENNPFKKINFTPVKEGFENTIKGFQTSWGNLKSWIDGNNLFKKISLDGIKSGLETLKNKTKDLFKGINPFKGLEDNCYNFRVYFQTKFLDIIKNKLKELSEQIGKSTIGKAINSAIAQFNRIIDLINSKFKTKFSHIQLIGETHKNQNVKTLKETYAWLPKMAEGGVVTDKTFAEIGEGQYNEAVLPLSENTYKNLAKNIQRYNTPSNRTIDENTLYRAFSRALNDAPQQDRTISINGKTLVREITREMNSQSRRYSPTKA